jgi:hypothetical protein
VGECRPLSQWRESVHVAASFAAIQILFLFVIFAYNLSHDDPLRDVLAWLCENGMDIGEIKF